MIADILLVAGALGAGFYCFILAQRLNRFSDLEKGVGGAVAVLSSQVDDLNKSLQSAQSVSAASSTALDQLTNRAEDVSKRLELLMASMHDVPDPIAEHSVTQETTRPDSQPMFSRRMRGQSGASQ